MPTPSPEIIHLLSNFASAFTAPTFVHVVVLVYGVILAPGRRTVCSALRAVGRGEETHFVNYHRVLSRAAWSPWVLSELLLRLILAICVPAAAPLLLLIDETLERRSGEKIKNKSVWRDPLRSTVKHISYVLGIRWVCLAVAVKVPWSQRLWALPFMLIPARSPKTSAQLGKRHRTLVEWADIMLSRVRRWQPDRQLSVVGDGSYAAVALVARCQRLKRPIQLVSRLRLDAVLHAPPAPQPSSKRGPKPKKGTRLPSLAARLADPQTTWQTVSVEWYGGQERTLEYVTDTALWYTPGQDPVSLRWVLVRCPSDKNFKACAFFCSDPSVSVQTILTWFIARWNIEVSFEEVRAQLGFETQRGWSERSMERTTPALFGLFSLVVLMAIRLHPQHLPARHTAWYTKSAPTFSDALAAVRRDLWGVANYATSSLDPDLRLIPRPILHALVDLACYST